MHSIRVFTDSTNDLSPELIAAHNIGVIPLYVVFGEQSFQDGITITPEKLYRLVRETGNLPKTAAPTPADFYMAFKPVLEQGQDILYIGLSSHISSTIANARLAAQELDESRIKIIDSLNLSSGIGLLVLKACDLIREGKSLAETEAIITAAVPKIKTAFTIDTMEFLYKGGRCSALQSIFGTLLSIKPIIQVVNGDMELAQKARKRNNALKTILDNTMADLPQMDLTRIMITHSMGEADARYLRQELIKKTEAKEVLITEAGCVISSHCGENTVGILYLLK